MGSHESALALTVNGQAHELRVDPRSMLLDALREKLRLTGTKKAATGANAVPARCWSMAGGCCRAWRWPWPSTAPVTTIEGLVGVDGELHPVQRAFLDNDAFQCGFCTPGQVMSAYACIAEGHANSLAEIREWMSGNICRCAAYPQIVAAVAEAAQLTPKESVQ